MTQSRVAHKRNQAKLQVNNFLDAELESSVQVDATSQESEEKKQEQDLYLRELELINDLPELLLGNDS